MSAVAEDLRVAFRVDASTEIGSGHVMRCLTLADALAEIGARCTFVMRQKPGNLEEAVRGRGHSVVMLPPPESAVSASGGEEEPSHAQWLGTHWAYDASETLTALADVDLDWLVVDHYALDARWESRVAGCARRLMVLDDLADRKHNCDLLLDQNLGRRPEDYASLVSPETKRLIGPGFALLRNEFVRVRESSLRARAEREPMKLLVSLGGVDADNITGDVLDVLADMPEAGRWQVTVVLGAACPHAGSIRKQADTMSHRVDVVVGASNMAELMASADLAIGAAGGSAWERCCLGLPTLLVVMADNQRPGAQALEAAGAAICLGGPDGLQERLADELRRLMKPGNDILPRLASRAASLCDGLGTRRVLDCLKEAQSE
ncbi:MAG: UDP-2,4-diacetamido-2,4,6-trideoxy-beta-L-altropyranose hydrolase [Pseudomonadota bacterium]|nr:UDP-2,4-diacetamido-2,4,6-trideoxy-beta-L-altropyranose hydrolase [Pseudomonadota bacterium]